MVKGPLKRSLAPGLCFLWPEHSLVSRFPPADTHTLPEPHSLNHDDFLTLSQAAAAPCSCHKHLCGQTYFCGPVLLNRSTVSPSLLRSLWVQLPTPCNSPLAPSMNSADELDISTRAARFPPLYWECAAESTKSRVWPTWSLLQTAPGPPLNSLRATTSFLSSRAQTSCTQGSSKADWGLTAGGLWSSTDLQRSVRIGAVHPTE